MPEVGISLKLKFLFDFPWMLQEYKRQKNNYSILPSASGVRGQGRGWL